MVAQVHFAHTSLLMVFGLRTKSPRNCCSHDFTLSCRSWGNRMFTQERPSGPPLLGAPHASHSFESSGHRWGKWQSRWVSDQSITSPHFSKKLTISISHVSRHLQTPPPQKKIMMKQPIQSTGRLLNSSVSRHLVVIHRRELETFCSQEYWQY